MTIIELKKKRGKPLSITSKAKEREILKSFLDWLTLHKYCHVRVNISPIMRGGGQGKLHFTPNPMAGFPDVMLVLKGQRRGQIAFLEAKTATGKLRDSQKAVKEKWGGAGVPYCEARNILDLISFLSECGEII
jgi:hypothetical protein